jgi:hypothetical protein
MGITIISERNPRIINIPGIGNLQIHRGETYADIFEAVYDNGHKDGVLVGKTEKIDEIKKCLNI